MRRFYAKSWYFQQKVLRKSSMHATPSKNENDDRRTVVNKTSNKEHQSQECMQKTSETRYQEGLRYGGGEELVVWTG